MYKRKRVASLGAYSSLKKAYSSSSKARARAAVAAMAASRGRVSRTDGELKFFDTTLSFNVDATGEVPATGQLVLIPQGVTESTRVGRKCNIRSIQMKMDLVYTPAASATGVSVCYLYLIWDKQCNGAAAAATDVLTSASFQLALGNVANSSRFLVIKKWEVVLQSQAGVQTAFAADSKQIAYYKKCNIPLEYSSTAGAITELKSNNLFLMAGTDTGSDDVVNCSGICRVRFSDQ